MRFLAAATLVALTGLQSTVAQTATTAAVNQAACDGQCPPGNQICYVVDGSRTASPWHNSTQAWPQCYDPTSYSCQSDIYFICPSDAPVVCGRSCYVAGTDCSTTGSAAATPAQYASTTKGCTAAPTSAAPTTSATTAATAAPTTAAAGGDATGTTSPSSSAATTAASTTSPATTSSSATCQTLPSIPSGLGSVPSGAVRVLLNITGAEISSDLVCSAGIYNVFNQMLITELGSVLSVSNPTQTFKLVSSQLSGDDHSLEAVIDVLASSASTSSVSRKLMNNRRSMRTSQLMNLMATTTETPAGYVQQLQGKSSDALASTTYLRSADLKNLQVLCPSSNTFTSNCPDVFNAPATTTSGDSKAAVGNTSSSNYFDSHLIWEIPVIVVVGVLILALAVGLIAYTLLRRHRANKLDKEAARPAQYDPATDDAVVGTAIPVGAHAVQHDATKDVLSPSTRNEFVYVPAAFKEDTKAADVPLPATPAGQHFHNIATTANNSEDELSERR